jgi:hypothetical protein
MSPKLHTTALLKNMSAYRPVHGEKESRLESWNDLVAIRPVSKLGHKRRRTARFGGLENRMI